MKAGIKDPIAVQRGVAVYTEVGERAVTIPVEDQYASAATGRVTVQYVEPSENGPLTHRRDGRGPELGRGSSERDSRMLGAGKKLGAIALLGLCCAGAVSAPAATPVADNWVADPEAQFLLDVQPAQPPPRGRRARLSDARGHLRHLRRFPQRPRRADEDRPGREESRRLGLQGRAQDIDRCRLSVS